MRTCMYCTLIFISAAAFGQETNFVTGPQYLITTGAPMFARAISTPSVSFSSPPLEVGADNATVRLTAGAENQTVLSPADALPQVDSSISTTERRRLASSRSALRNPRRPTVNFPPAFWTLASGSGPRYRRCANAATE